MLNALKLSELLAKNVDPQLYPRMFVMSPNGTLMAYSTPVDIKDLRDQAALISMAWKEHEATFQAKHSKPSNQSEFEESSSILETLTIEFQHNNIIIRAIQPKLLLVLVGGVPPSRRTIFKVTTEAYGDPRYPPIDPLESDSAPPDQLPQGDSSAESSLPAGEDHNEGKKKAASIMSHMSQREKDIKVGVLHIQRKKLDALTAFIREDFDSKGFVMPDDSSFP
ncbi:hypothetical protein K505DRAFT_331170 [Melanomma pulvis-pyrius CBS 109.77]|uniref:Roadblock/LAMTOR2 domain-containing protein n=1 Tax=Melanomma pulvis-pyrius CBS 109.77 TaxID=1314802 RepID=A0A6A6XX04_9PLEO|nr:hypothetical protein K505DRAFT_331170 [Melanomma pulvis-pyrius CBS 109.77]